MSDTIFSLQLSTRIPTWAAAPTALQTHYQRGRQQDFVPGMRVSRSGLPRVFVRALACKRLVNTFFAGPHVPGQGADDYRRDRVAQADRVVPVHGVLPTPRALPVVYTKHPHDCNQPKHPPMTVCVHDIVGLGRVVAPTGHPPTESLRAGIAGWHQATAI